MPRGGLPVYGSAQKSNWLPATICYEPRSDTMGDKSPKNTNAKKPARSLKEKRAAKHAKRRHAIDHPPNAW
jgi:hypothetical protein